MKPLFVCVLTGIVGLTSSASAATFNIENGDVVALGKAIEIANSNNQSDVINLATKGTYKLATALPTIVDDGGCRLTINGSGAKMIRGNNLETPAFTILAIEKGALVFVSLLTLSNGTGAHGDGGAIFSSGNLKLTHCTLSDNAAQGAGGAIFSNGPLQLIGCTLSGNSATRGGAIHLEDSAASIINCTLSGNKASDSGGGINFLASGTSSTLTVSHCTFAENIATAGDDLSATGDEPAIATAQFDNSIFNSQNAAPNLVASGKGVLASKGNNMCIDDSGELRDGTDHLKTDALLKPLADNGGPTLTHMFDTESKALDNGTWGAIPMKDGVITDQRGKPRPQGPTYDIGAVEIDNLYAPIVEEGVI